MIPREPDSLDIGFNDTSKSLTNPNLPPSSGGTSRNNTIISALAQNPQRLISLFGMTPKQAQNVSQIITGAGAGLGAVALQRMLERHIGKRMAAALGGGLGGYFTAAILENLMKEDNG